MLIRKPSDIPSSEITPHGVYLRRREFLSSVAAMTAAVAAGPGLLSACEASSADAQPVEAGQDEIMPFEDATRYNNFYEFGTGKTDPYKNAQDFVTKPWTLSVEGMVKNPAEYQLEDFLKPYTIVDRVYRLRCVEAWSMVIPYQGIPLADVIKRVEPLGSAQYVELTTLFDPQQMPGQRRPILDWPYVEGLRLDEAMHPLSLLTTGIYGEDLPNQNGAPLRLTVPWKYGFKHVKSIVKMRFTEQMPRTTWAMANPREYGFYANVNPEVDHPRWSQARERRIGELRKRPTLMLNGYADQVGHLYAGMDPKTLY